MLTEYPVSIVRAFGRNETGATVELRISPDAGGLPPGLTDQDIAELISDRFAQIPGMSVQIARQDVVTTRILEPTEPTPDPQP